MIRLLLDSHAAIWWFEDRGELSSEAIEAIADMASEVYVSSASVWEVGLKYAAGRLRAPTSLADAARDADFRELPVTWVHAERAADLPPVHRDPFDRMLVAQALEEKLVLVTRDPLVRQYPVATLAA